MAITDNYPPLRSTNNLIYTFLYLRKKQLLNYSLLTPEGEEGLDVVSKNGGCHTVWHYMMLLHPGAAVGWGSLYLLTKWQPVVDEHAAIYWNKWLHNNLNLT